MDINKKLNTLLINLSPAHKLYLNDKMNLIKLYNNNIFNTWLQSKTVDIMPTFKHYHTAGNRTYMNIPAKDGEPILPQFITMAIIKNDSIKDFKFICCNVNTTEISKKEFEKKSGVLFNGAFYFLRQHVLADTYGTRSLASEYAKETGFNQINMPIGAYKHKYIEN